MSSGDAESIFNTALGLRADERREFVAKACRDDEVLESKVWRLLSAHERAAGFLQKEESGLSGLSRPAAVAEEPGAWIDRYRLVKRLGEGGFGVVFLAAQTDHVQRLVALKIIKPGMDSADIITRFKAERQASALMDHRAIAQVFDAGETESGRPYFVMELVEGVRITEYCHDESVSTVERLELFCEVCDAIQHAHQKGIIHRDIKPSNVMVTIQEGRPLVKVIDFGIAKSVSVPLTEQTLMTMSGQLMGTPAYMSPEQTRSDSVDIDTRSDIYALGVLLYELLTGRTPLDHSLLARTDLVEMCRYIREEDPPRPSQVFAQLPLVDQENLARSHQNSRESLLKSFRSDLDWIVMKAIEKERARRYATANGLALDVKRFLSHQPIEAAAPSATYRLRKFVGRYRVLLGMFVALVCSLLLGAGFASWQAWRATKARDRAQVAEAAAERESRAQQRATQEAQYQQYIATMNMVHRDWDQNNLIRIPHLLAASKASENRGFEWFYWLRQLHRAENTLSGHLAGVRDVAWSPNGESLASASDDFTVKVWDLDHGRARFTIRHQAEVHSVAYSPAGDLILTSSQDQTVRLWEALDGKEVAVLSGHKGGVLAARFSTDGRFFVTTGEDRMVLLWDRETRQERMRIGPFETTVRIAFSPDSSLLVTVGHLDRTARVWRVLEGALMQVIEHPDAVCDAAVFPDGKRLVTGCADGVARIWNLMTGELINRLFGHDAQVWSVEALPNRDGIATGSWDQTARIWDASTGASRSIFRGHLDSIWALASAPNEDRLVTASRDGTVKVWGMEESEGGLVLPPEDELWREPRAVAFSPEGDRFAVAGGDDVIRVREAMSGQALFSFAAQHGRVSCLAFTPDGRHLASGGDDGILRVWDPKTGAIVKNWNAKVGAVNSLALSRDGRRLVTGGREIVAHVWDFETGELFRSLEGHTASIRSVAISDDGTWIATGGGDAQCGLWELKSGRLVRFLDSDNGGISSVSISPNNNHVVVSGNVPPKSTVWDMPSGERLLELEGHRDPVTSVAFSARGDRIVTGGWDGSVRVWDAMKGQELLILRGHKDWVWQVMFSPNDRSLLSIGADWTLRMWRGASENDMLRWEQEVVKVAEDQARARQQRENLLSAARELNWIDPGCLKTWSVLGPIALPTEIDPAIGNLGVQALELQQVANESTLWFDQNYGSMIGGTEIEWQRVDVADGVLVLHEILGDGHGVAYAVSGLTVPQSLAGVRVLLGGGDLLKLYLNGEVVMTSYREFDGDPLGLRLGTGLTLRAGWNSVVMKVVSEGGSWSASLRFTDRHGNSIPDLSSPSF